jgi:tRNA G10  N-methylase Trm11
MVKGTRENLRWLEKDGIVKKWDASELSKLWGKRQDCSFVFDPPYGRSSWKSDDSLEIFLSVLREAKKIDGRGVVSTMLPSGPDSLTLENADDSIVMGRKWSDLLGKIEDAGWNVHLFCPVRVHKSLVRVIVVCHPAD